MTVAAAPTRPTPNVLQLGLGWFAEQSGGLERFYAGLVAHAADGGFRARGLVVGSADVARQSGGTVTAYARPDQPLLARWAACRAAVAAATAAERFDLWASHFALYAFPVVRRLRHLPHVVHFQGPWAGEARREGQPWPAVGFKSAVEHRVYRSADRLLTLSEAFATVLCQSYGIDRAKVRVVPGAVPIDAFDIPTPRADARAALGWPADRRIVLCVRRLVHRMGLLNLVTAVDRLRHRHPDLLCLIGGRGPLEPDLRAAVDRAGLADHVRLLGFVPDEQLPLAYRAADLSVVPTEAWEGFGLIVVESLAAGTPVVVTPVDALPEIVRPLSPQLVTADASPAGLADVLGGWLDGRVVPPDAAACLAYARRRYDWPAVARIVGDVYREVV